jgi:hypothetical protein
VSVTLGIQHAMPIHHIAICGLPAKHYFPHYLTIDTILEIKLQSKKMSVLIFSATFVQTISHSKKK